jgi:hypothetical protein
MSVKRFLNRSRSRSARTTPQNTAITLMSLEQRVMMHVDPNDPTHVDELPDDLGTFPVITADPAGTGGTTSAASASSPLTAVPALSSNPSAAAKIYLDFTGDSTTTWGTYTPGVTPAYDTDGDATTFSDSELTSIQQIYSRVAEKFSPFNVDVTTVSPGNLTNRQTLKVVIGGSGTWLGAQAGGVSYVGSFANSSANVVFVFPKMLANGVAQYVAEAAAHESGHAFGLYHQSTYDAQGVKTAEYAPANSNNDAPIMGNSYTARRGLWWDGTASDSVTDIQDDLSVISSTTNGFGHRTDDYGNTLATASTLSLNGTTISTQGIIEKTSDADVFAFTTGAGAVSLSASPASLGAMLDLKLELQDSTGAVIATQDSGLGESLSTMLGAGTYYVTIASHGSYGDVGQYTLTGAIIPPGVTPPPIATVPAAPSNLTVKNLTSNSNRLSWIDNSTDETGFKIYASQNGSTWTMIGNVGANVTSVDNTGLRRNAVYYYQVQASNTVGDSAVSNVASTKTALTSATTVLGDANLDGTVDFNDLTIIAQNYGKTGATWNDGDFNSDGVVDFTDLTAVAQNYGTVLPADTPDTSDWGTLTLVSNAVPAVSSSSTGQMATTSVNTKATLFSTRPITVHQRAVRKAPQRMR